MEEEYTVAWHAGQETEFLKALNYLPLELQRWGAKPRWKS